MAAVISFPQANDSGLLANDSSTAGPRSPRSGNATKSPAGLAVQVLATGTGDHAYIYTTDITAEEGAETVLGGVGYAASVTFVNGYRFIEDLVE